MSEMAGAEGIGAEVAGDVVGVAETGLHAAEGVYDAVKGDWNGAADNSLSMAEGALGVATAGISELAEAGWDAVAHETGLPSAHEALSEATQAVGNALGDGLFELVGEDQAHQSAVAFDDGDILGGIGHMAEGAAETIGSAIEEGASEAGQAFSEAATGVEQGAEELWNEVTE
jgi:hypothetical protein